MDECQVKHDALRMRLVEELREELRRAIDRGVEPIVERLDRLNGRTITHGEEIAVLRTRAAAQEHALDKLGDVVREATSSAVAASPLARRQGIWAGGIASVAWIVIEVARALLERGAP